jgi:hypothetical protein
LRCFVSHLTILILKLSKISRHWPRAMPINRKVASTLRRTYGRRPRRHSWEGARLIWSQSFSILSLKDWKTLWKKGECILIDFSLCVVDYFLLINPLGKLKKIFSCILRIF